mmetsp:Transcript_14975/g.31000  ORF Transcript_14975/g.31000 Transcript_14975/m.31000 type:complete len:88 (-) Transcript_14975:254-517(-)
MGLLDDDGNLCGLQLLLDQHGGQERSRIVITIAVIVERRRPQGKHPGAATTAPCFEVKRRPTGSGDHEENKQERRSKAMNLLRENMQ